jgi:two-component system NtrC family sensor kinase
MAEHGVPPHSEPQQTLRSISEEIERLTALTEDYLRFARLPEPQPAPGDLNEWVEAVIDFQRDELEAAGIEIQLSLDPDLAPIRGDSAQLRRALLNLTRNAREAMEGRDRRLLLITTRAQPDRVLLSIEDSGCGMDPAQAARIFEPFFSTKHHGTGLGLPLTLQIVEEHGGTLECRSTPDRGTSFLISLPAANAP